MERGAGGVGMMNSMYTSLIPDGWRSQGGEKNINDSRLSNPHPYQEENYFEYDEDMGIGGKVEYNYRNGENIRDGNSNDFMGRNSGDLTSENHGDGDNDILARLVGVWSEACRCFDMGTGDGEPVVVVPANQRRQRVTRA